MSNRFPLIIDAATQRILELPATDNLDLSSSNISNVSNINSVGNVTASYFIGNGSSLTGITANPAGSNTQIQFNDANTFGASANFTINTSTGVLAAPTFSGTTANLVNINVSGNLVPTNLILDSFNETLPASANTSTSISPDVALGTIFRYTANANFTFNGLTNAVAGTSTTVIVTQDGTGNRLLTSTMKFAGNSKTLSTAANSIDIMGVFYDGSTYYASLTKGYV
jgi:hypothetical protein